MISVDTNILVRLLTKDDVEQFQQSLKLFQKKLDYQLYFVKL